jgi:predicted ATPase
VQAVLQKQQNTATLSYSFVQGKGTTAQFKPQNVGFGLTYVLPVVTAILKSKPGDLLLIENPESHLHPAAQSVLGRLCCLAATAGVQIFIESHSDHFLNGVRVAVKKGIIEPDNVALFFLERNLKSKRHDSIICNPAIDNNGRLDEWPQGFFDEWEIQLKELL